MQKILFINMAKGFGGGEVQAYNLISQLPDSEIFFYGRKNSKLIEKLQSLPQVQCLFSLSSLFKAVYQNQNIIIHALDGRGAHLAAVLGLLFKRKFVITRQVNFPLKGKWSQIAYRNADAVIGVSKKIRDNLMLLNHNAHCIYAGVGVPQENEPFENQHFSEKHKLAVCHIGNFQKVKNFPLTIELARKCLQNNLDIHFYLVGDGECKQELIGLAEGVSNVHFIGKTPYIGTVFKKCDIQMIPSENEGLSLVLLEGYQYLCPVIANNVGGMTELVRDQKTGFLINENKLDDYYQILWKVYQQPDLLMKLKDEIHLYNRENDFSVQAMVEKYLELYPSL